MFALSELVIYQIASIRKEAGNTHIYKMNPVTGKRFDFVPGQFVFMHILDEKGGSIVKRAYSIASAPHEKHLELCIKLIGGELTSKLENLGEGDKVGIEGPFGHFKYGDESEAAFVAGGTGVVPFIGILRHINKNKIMGKFVLFYSTKTMDQILYKKELEKLEAENLNITVVITLTRETPREWDGECGRINGDILYKYTEDTNQFNWWICGPMEMIKNIKNHLIVLGVDTDKIKMEGWG
ncbi:FAD-dependent oxidoreductase [Candidatus Micrarchaeota archaeon]|nr:FAD-dependent oxidoreductase [Candidatus Micrarchaeota archaeon]MBU1166733.1 FAD-dependent oxidoreductase [Candidatus Micrarchaeota archaeon]MBU1886696.1 FAD-dependent oxidoreductase [Candidatus Micrarchaeota archaeon]